jgi:polyisoprenoid-binding protein YceI
MNNNKFSDNLRGNLFIAGKSRNISIPVSGTINNQSGTNIITISGETELKMSDFDISPPSFLIGAIKTGNIVTCSFSLQFLQKQ